MQNGTNLKKVIQEAKESVGESEIRSRMQPLKDVLIKIISDLHGFLDFNVFTLFCRALWDRMGQVAYPYPKTSLMIHPNLFI